MKALFLVTLFLFTCHFCFAQNKQQVDSLKHLLISAKEDTNKVKLLTELSENYLYSSFEDTTQFYAYQALQLAEKLKDERGVAKAQRVIGVSMIIVGNYPVAVEYTFLSMAGFEKLKDTLEIAKNNLTYCFKEQGDFENALKYHLSTMKLLELYYAHSNRITTEIRTDLNLRNWGALGHIYHINNNQIDSSIKYVEKYFEIKKGWNGLGYTLGDDYYIKGQYDKAMYYFKLGLDEATVLNVQKDKLEHSNGIAKTYVKLNNLDSATYYSSQVVNSPYKQIFPRSVLEASLLLAKIYENQYKPDSAFKYYKQALALKDTLSNKGKVIAIQNLLFKEDQKKKALAEVEIINQNRLKMYGLLSGLVVLFLAAFFLWRNNRHKQKAYNLLQKQKQETDFQKEKVEKTLTELKSTQAQLIQKEKLASLGELTAGIAHEIQNPLNFVNNFSELSVDRSEERRVGKECCR